MKISLKKLSLACSIFALVGLYHKNLIPASMAHYKKKVHPAMHKKRQELAEVNTIVFDLVGVLFYVDKFRALNMLGTWKVLSYFVRNFSNPFDDILTLLNRMRQEMPGEFQGTVKYISYLLPNSMIEWQKGRLSTQSTIERIRRYLTHLENEGELSHPSDKDMMMKLLNMMVNPQTLQQCIKADNAMIKEVKNIKALGTYKLYLLSNLDTESYEMFFAAYPEFFGLFDGVMVSSQVHTLKPFPEIYQRLLGQYNLKPHQCLFVDDQEENIVAAEKLGFHTYLFKKTREFITFFTQYLRH